MNITKLVDQLKIDEGVRLRTYNDHLGYKTVGIGHLIKPTDPSWAQELEVGDKITESQMIDLFELDLAIAISDAKVIFEDVWDEFPDIAQQVFVNMLFNLGRSRFLKFKKTIMYAYSKDWDKVATEMLDSRWAKQVGIRAYRLSAQIERM